MGLKEKLNYLTAYQHYSNSDKSHAPYRWVLGITTAVIGATLLQNSEPSYQISGLLFESSMMAFLVSLVVDREQIRRKEQEKNFKNDILKILNARN